MYWQTPDAFVPQERPDMPDNWSLAQLPTTDKQQQQNWQQTQSTDLPTAATTATTVAASSDTRPSELQSQTKVKKKKAHTSKVAADKKKSKKVHLISCFLIIYVGSSN